MTCIVGVVKYDHVIIGGDSAASNGSNCEIRRDPKVFYNGDFLFGCTTSYRMIQLLRYSLEIPPVEENDLYRYMCTSFIDSVRECFARGGFLQSFSEGDEKGGQFLVAFKNRLFKIDDDFQVAEKLDGIDSIGCASDFALGSMNALLGEGFDPGLAVKKSLEIAEAISLGIKAPFIILETKNK